MMLCLHYAYQKSITHSQTEEVQDVDIVMPMNNLFVRI